MILIDIQKSCIVQVSGEVKREYVALSYVWGNIPGVLELRTDNLSQLSSPGSLNTPENMARIPKTILNAMTLSTAIGVQYLWVDRLCIVQDDPSSFNEQLEQMASIYSHSCFTIIALDGSDANYGLPGSCSKTSPRSRSFKQPCFKFSDELTMTEKIGLETRFEKPPWHTRAWTFQERALSPRTVVFTGDSVYWACRSAVWYETLAGEPDGTISSTKIDTSHPWPNFGLNFHPWPNIEYYFRLASYYNERKLTYESDAQNAFSAITNAMSPSFPGGFLRRHTTSDGGSG